MAREFIKDDEYEKYKKKKNKLEILAELGREEYEEIEKNYALEENTLYSEPSSTDDLRIVVIGKTGVGKSATANAIIGQKVFSDAGKADSVTFESKCFRKEINGRTVSVIDTPGLQDTARPQKEVLREIARVMKIFHDGIHVFVYVMNMASPRFTEEDETALQALEVKFGDNMKKYRMLVYTHADNNLCDEENLEAFCMQHQSSNTAIARFITELNGNIVAVNNKSKIPAERKRNQNVILGLADKITKANDNTVYTNHMFETASEERKKCIEDLLGRGFDPIVMESVETVIEENPQAICKKGALVKKVRKWLQETNVRSKEKIMNLRMRRTEEDINRMQFEARQNAEKEQEKQNQEEHKAEEEFRKAAELLKGNAIEKQAEEIGETHIQLLNNLQDKLKSLNIWKKFGV